MVLAQLNDLAAMDGVHSARLVLMPWDRGAHVKCDWSFEGIGRIVPKAVISPIGMPVAGRGGNDHCDKQESSVETLLGKVQIAMSCQDLTL